MSPDVHVPIEGWVFAITFFLLCLVTIGLILGAIFTTDSPGHPENKRKRPKLYVLKGGKRPS